MRYMIFTIYRYIDVYFYVLSNILHIEIYLHISIFIYRYLFDPVFFGVGSFRTQNLICICFFSPSLRV